MPLQKKRTGALGAEDDDLSFRRISDTPPQIDAQFTVMRPDGFTAEVLNVPSADTPPPDGTKAVEERRRSSHGHQFQPPPPSMDPFPDHQQQEEDEAPRGSLAAPDDGGAVAASGKRESRLSGVFHRRRSRSATHESSTMDEKTPARERERRLSAIFHRHRAGSRSSRSPSPTSAAAQLPAELEHILDDGENPEDNEAQWERRATVLAQQGAGAKLPAGKQQQRNQAHDQQLHQQQQQQQQYPPDAKREESASLQPPQQRPAQNRSRTISDAKSDDDIQKAIELHESGQLEQSTAMFGRLADPNGANNALSQVLYGLALRHGWGIPTDASQAVSYLSLAARNSAAIESQALASGMKKGGAAKGELVLAIYELANCYKMGLGLAKDPVAARRYFETAARLGDVDALEAAARCYEDGYGGKKDKFKAAKYYRQAEEKGHKIVGNSWIWKEKYDPKPSGGS